MNVLTQLSALGRTVLQGIQYARKIGQQFFLKQLNDCFFTIRHQKRGCLKRGGLFLVFAGWFCTFVVYKKRSVVAQ
jgi:hypothetical protein